MRRAVAIFLAFAGAASGAPALISLEDAVARTLASSPGVEVQRARIAQADGSLLSASGRFDWTTSLRLSESVRRTPALGAFPGGSAFDVIDFSALNDLLLALNRPPVAPPPPDPSFDVQREQQTALSFGVARQFRNGVTVIPSATVFDYRLNTSPVPPATRAEWGVQFIVPLARGRGRDATAADEQAARLGLDGARAAARHAIADRVGRTATAFWDCLAASQRLALLADTEHRAQDLLGLVSDLVQAGELEPAVRLEASAEAMRRHADLISGELELFSARQRLGAAVGLGVTELPDAPRPAGDFPVVRTTGESAANAASFAQLALRKRGDLLAAEQERQIEDVFARKARTELRPRVDLDVRTGYAGGALGESARSYASAFSRDLTGVNVSAAVSVEWPAANRASRGNLVRRNAQLREAELSVADLSTQIAAEVAIAHAAWQAAAQQYALARDTVSALGEVLAHQRRKLQLGETSLTTLVQNEDRYFQARTALISAARNHAVAVLDLRRVTGTLIDADPRGARLSLATLTSPPLASP